MADPGFPVGGAVDPQGGYVSKNLHVKTKESGARAPPRSANVQCDQFAWYRYQCYMFRLVESIVVYPTVYALTIVRVCKINY